MDRREGGGQQFAQNYIFLLNSNSLSIAALSGKVTLGRRKSIVYFLFSQSYGKQKFCIVTVLGKGHLRGSNTFNFGRGEDI